MRPMPSCVFVGTGALLSAFILGTQVYAASVDDGGVRRWIVAALTNKQDYPGDKADSATISARLDKAAVGAAWSRLQACRNKGQSLDLTLAAAEHYLFARTIASEEGDTDLKALPKQYADWKSWLQGKGLEQILKTSSEPVSPVNPDVTRWGGSGVDAGLADYKQRENKEPSSKSSSWSTKFGVLYAIGTRYLPDTRPCTVSIK